MWQMGRDPTPTELLVIVQGLGIGVGIIAGVVIAVMILWGRRGE